MADVMIECKVCKAVADIKACGMCQACYQRDYRKRMGVNGHGPVKPKREPAPPKYKWRGPIRCGDVVGDQKLFVWDESENGMIQLRGYGQCEHDSDKPFVKFVDESRLRMWSYRPNPVGRMLRPAVGVRA